MSNEKKRIESIESVTDSNSQQIVAMLYEKAMKNGGKLYQSDLVEATSGLDADIEKSVDEFKALMDNNTWSLCSRPLGKNVVPCKNG